MSVIPTVAELQQQLAQAAAAIDDLNRRGAIEHVRDSSYSLLTTSGDDMYECYE